MIRRSRKRSYPKRKSQRKRYQRPRSQKRSLQKSKRASPKRIRGGVKQDWSKSTQDWNSLEIKLANMYKPFVPIKQMQDAQQTVAQIQDSIADYEVNGKSPDWKELQREFRQSEAIKNTILQAQYDNVTL